MFKETVKKQKRRKLFFYHEYDNHKLVALFCYTCTFLTLFNYCGIGETDLLACIALLLQYSLILSIDIIRTIGTWSSCFWKEQKVNVTICFCDMKHFNTVHRHALPYPTFILICSGSITKKAFLTWIKSRVRLWGSTQWIPSYCHHCCAKCLKLTSAALIRVVDSRHPP